MKINPTPLAFLVLMLLSGCELLSPAGPRFTEVNQPDPNDRSAIVYIYRISDERYAGRVNISADGKHVSEIGDREYSWCKLPPGEHLIRAEWGIMDKPLFEGGQFDAKSLAITVKANSTYYICYSISNDGASAGIIENSGLLGKAISKSHAVFVGFNLDKENGREDVSSCKLRKSDLEQ